MSEMALLRMPSARTSSQGNIGIQSHCWDAEAPHRGPDAARTDHGLLKLLGDSRRYLDILTVAVGAALLPGAREATSSTAKLYLSHAQTATPAGVSLPIERRTVPVPAFSKLRHLNTLLHNGEFPAFSQESLNLAQNALRHLDERSGEDLEEWASQLARDLNAKAD